MLDFIEADLQYIWQNGLLNSKEFNGTKNEAIRIVHPGILNTNSGPDFLNGHVIINGTQLFGNIEIHSKASDWKKHGHQNDDAYNSLILHVVYEADETVPQNDDYNVPVISLKDYIHQKTIKNISAIRKLQGNKLLCSESKIHVGNNNESVEWVNRLSEERLNFKSRYILSLLNNPSFSLSQVFYTVILKSFGTNINNELFELISREVSLKLAFRYIDRKDDLLALFLGSSGLIDKHQDREILQDKFNHLKNLHSINEIKKGAIKYGRTRPGNFPHVRLAQFANWFNSNYQILIHPENTDLKTILNSIDNLKLYGHDKAFSNSVLINGFSHFYYALYLKYGKIKYKILCEELLKKGAFENNLKVRKFKSFKFNTMNARTSQAFIQLHDSYCIHHRCAECVFGKSVLK
ncbi:MAG: DUF2851 family protein [Bacteroidia bacterium]